MYWRYFIICWNLIQINVLNKNFYILPTTNEVRCRNCKLHLFLSAHNAQKVFLKRMMCKKRSFCANLYNFHFFQTKPIHILQKFGAPEEIRCQLWKKESNILFVKHLRIWFLDISISWNKYYMSLLTRSIILLRKPVLDMKKLVLLFYIFVHVLSPINSCTLQTFCCGQSSCIIEWILCSLWAHIA